PIIYTSVRHSLLFVFSCFCATLDLHSFPTRRYSDLAHAQGWGCRGSRMTLPGPVPGPWQHWDLHPSVIIGLVLLGGLYVFLGGLDRKSTRLNSSHQIISYAVFCLKKKKTPYARTCLT